MFYSIFLANNYNNHYMNLLFQKKNLFLHQLNIIVNQDLLFTKIKKYFFSFFNQIINYYRLSKY